MSDLTNLGVYGKIPAHGDFVHQNLPRHFLDRWDHWMQQSILASQDSLGEAWLGLFLISPVWRFALPRNVIDDQVWAGIILPSVDKVGRYYPLTLVSPLPASVGVCELMSKAKSWFASLEDAAITVLEQGLDIDGLINELQTSLVTPELDHIHVDDLNPQHRLQHVIPLSPFTQCSTENSIQGVMPQLCDALIRTQSVDFSVWWTEGGEHVESAMLLADKLPRPTSYAAMLNGQWQNWHWPSLLHSREL